MMRLLPILLAAVATLAPAMANAQTPPVVVSPDGRTRLEIDAASGLRYRVVRDGAEVIATSPIGMVTSQGGFGTSESAVTSSEASAVNDTYVPVAGKASRVADRYNQVVLHLTRGKDGVTYDLVARAYDDGVAFRFVVAAQPRFDALDVYWETTGFYFPADYACWGANSGRFENSHETEFDPIKASAMRGFHLYDAPLLCRTGKGETSFAIVEADKRDYPGAYYARRADAGLGVNVALTSRRDNIPDSPAFKVSAHAALTQGPLLTPWRTVMIANRPGDLIESSLVQLLAAPSAIADTSWIKPGKSAWDWWNGWAVNVPNPGINTATYRAYIDFAKAMGLEYILIDEGWYKGSSEGPRPADVTVPVPAVDIPGLVKYGAERNVGVWVWLQWKQLQRQLDAALPLYEAWGIKGIKVDFMDRNDQEMVEFYHELLSKAAAHHLMVDLHGAYPPDGLLRTYPNFVTQEGVLGAEYNKFGARITATHNVTLPFTRMLLGPMDYTPGGFRALPPAEFATKHRLLRPYVQTTRGQAIAMYVVYESPLVMLSDSPDAYIGADGRLTDGADFLKQVPTSWDETRFISGEIGQSIVLARRKGDRWYIGAMTNEQGRKISVPLATLGAGKRWRARIWQDGADMNHLKTSTTLVQSRDHVQLTLAPSGGAAMVLEPAGD
ncbi:glycoside hydrolase family 97 protein [Sphingomonas sp. H39-1-10]|uniref:glycoside hydrolase family 97 protein n=1 Tax=Sphingomonas pollutisoli TaxID=3030829 RepID=UPI0023B9E978|nr:glycoside hydrolase family 97 protein [Sphingomonas pollutisoli]MDF0486531.1 glycoside hydrolase family 97 protein [Sphingomonas pollutisoli]